MAKPTKIIILRKIHENPATVWQTNIHIVCILQILLYLGKEEL